MTNTTVIVQDSAVVAFFGHNPKVVGSNPDVGNKYFFFLFALFGAFNLFQIKKSAFLARKFKLFIHDLANDKRYIPQQYLRV